MLFICGHCGAHQETTGANHSSKIINLNVGNFAERHTVPQNSRPHLGVSVTGVKCVSLTCQKVSIFVSAGTTHEYSTTQLVPDSIFYSSMILPGPCGIPFPEGVPPAMLEDYQEAWAIIDLSPKSSATLARRCLQAMIRDFCGIQLKNLYQEIQALETKLENNELPKGVEVETVAAMKALRDVGNIGAHMQVADGQIVNIEPGEAQALLALIEMLFADWYVARHKRQKALAKIVKIGSDKAGMESI